MMINRYKIKRGALLPTICTMMVVLFSQCNNVLDIENISSYSSENVWDDEQQVDAYIANIYPMFGNWDPTGDVTSQQLDGIHFYGDMITISNDNYKDWNYERLRLINQAIEEVTAGGLDQEKKDEIVAQSLFMRAYTYFNMVKYHGGVPYLTKPQDKDVDDLYVARNSTKECFELIIKDIDDAIVLLPEMIGSDSEDFGKIDGAFAKAFKAKVLLYKASPQFNPSSPWSNEYWSSAYDVNKAVYEELSADGYGLVDNYSDIFLDEGNREAIFTVINSYPNKTASWDYGVRPGSESRGKPWASPTWEFVKEFPMRDGKMFDDPSSIYAKTEEELLQNFWDNRDPRFEESLVWNGKIYEVSGQTGRRQYTALGVAHELDDFGTNPDAGVNSSNLDDASGMFILKGSDLSLTQAEVEQYDIDYVLMRFAEVMLNYAECANETGHLSDAVEIIKQIRERAGIEPGADDLYGIDNSSRESMREVILNERNIELCFEGFRFWDLRRLRMLDRLDGTNKHGIEAIAINEDGSDMSISEAISKADTYELTSSNFKYLTHTIPFTGVQESSLPETYYFFPIQQQVIDRNSNIEQNNNWGGTFNPTLE